MEVYTDGGCIGNPGPGGFGVVFVENDRIVHEHRESFRHTTNNRMEYRAAIYALETIKAKGFTKVKLHTDSKYVLQSVTEWGHKWKHLGWARNASGTKAIENVDLFKRCYELNQELSVDWIWVKGHAGNRWNERADQLANGAATNQVDAKEDVVEGLTPAHSTAQASLF